MLLRRLGNGTVVLIPPTSPGKSYLPLRPCTTHIAPWVHPPEKSVSLPGPRGAHVRGRMLRLRSTHPIACLITDAVLGPSFIPLPSSPLPFQKAIKVPHLRDGEKEPLAGTVSGGARS